MLPNMIENCPAILRVSEFLQQCGLQIQDERERGPVSSVIATKASSRSNEKSRQK
jgi:hypothetical protein